MSTTDDDTPQEHQPEPNNKGSGELKERSTGVPAPNDQASLENPESSTHQAEVVDLKQLSHAKRHSDKEKRMEKMQKSFERFLPINTESRQVKRRKARKKKKSKK